MRSTFVCTVCGIHYLPPETMIYPTSGTIASPAHCARPECGTAARTGPVPLAMLEKVALEAVRRRELVERRIGRNRAGRAKLH
jgi:hypothetical protein